MIKPRIKRYCAWMPHPLSRIPTFFKGWKCEGDNRMGLGSTPWRAYRNWWVK